MNKQIVQGLQGMKSDLRVELFSDVDVERIKKLFDVLPPENTMRKDVENGLKLKMQKYHEKASFHWKKYLDGKTKEQKAENFEKSLSYAHALLHILREIQHHTLPMVVSQRSYNTYYNKWGLIESL